MNADAQKFVDKVKSEWAVAKARAREMYGRDAPIVAMYVRLNLHPLLVGAGAAVALMGAWHFIASVFR
jgi:hypothetical protein